MHHLSLVKRSLLETGTGKGEAGYHWVGGEFEMFRVSYFCTRSCSHVMYIGFSGAFFSAMQNTEVLILQCKFVLINQKIVHSSPCPHI